MDARPESSLLIDPAAPMTLEEKLRRLESDWWRERAMGKPLTELMTMADYAGAAARLALEEAEGCAPGGLCKPNCRGYYDFQLRLRKLAAGLKP